MTPPEKRKRVSISTPSQQPMEQQQQQQQSQSQHPLVALTPPLMPYHPHSPLAGHPHMVPVVPFPVCHPHAHPHYYISVASPPNALGVTPQVMNVPTTTPLTSTTTTSPRYERILPKRPSDASPSSSPSGPYAYTMQPSPLSLPQHHHSASTVPALFPLPPSAFGQQPTTADQREQARKVSHSAIERRRRERINDKIMQLKQIIPNCADQENLHKMSILQSAIDYIIYLKKQVEEDTTTTSTTTTVSSTVTETTTDQDDPPVVMEPLKPIDIMKNNNASSFHHSAPPCRPDSPTQSLEQNSHMKLDHLLS
ncbi:hypothetical protein BC941DRAFT_416555 [Chlamydoabsidia padenii]|nr:hypothetical protein BC941DRAFT_416555 [Chlamydoabsidia padenii]